MFKANNLDFVICLITAADVIHVNKIKSVVHVANLVLLNYEFAREQMSDKMENVILLKMLLK